MKWMIFAAASLAVVSCASLSLEDLEFHAWKLKFGKIYSTLKEEAWRKDIWLSTRRRVLAHNILADQGIKTYRMGMNQFSDMDEDEYRLTLHSKLMPLDFVSWTSHSDVLTTRQEEGTVPPDSVDWRAQGCVTPVRDQGSCGSCYAFAAVGAVESHTCIKYERDPIPLSVQQVTDCSWFHRNHGCEGGLPSKVFNYLRDSQGIVTEKEYPYRDSEFFCHFPNVVPPYMIAAKITGHKQIASGDERDLMKAVAEGPVTVAVDARLESFKHYKSGVYYEPACTTYNLTHAMLLVGYGTEDLKIGSEVISEKYWLVKNSWDTTWGEEGYIKMARNKKNNCGIATFAVYPIV